MFLALEIFATQVAVAIENLTYQRTIEAIQRVGIEISSTRDRNTLFMTVHKQLKRLMSAEVMMIGRYYQDRDEIKVLYRQALVPEEQDLPLRRSAQKGLTGSVDHGFR